MEYEVIKVSEGGLGTLLFGASGFPVRKLRDTLNEHGAAGWRLVFQVIEIRRYMLFWKRETVIITFERVCV